MKQHPLTRRQVLHHLATAGVAATAIPSFAATTEPASAPSASDVEAANRLFAHNYTPAESELMTDGLETKRNVATHIRSLALPYTIPPAISFRALPSDASPPTSDNSFALPDAPLPAYNGDPASLAFATVADLSRLIHARKITSTALTQLCLARLKDIGPRLNCVITLTEDLALSQAKRADQELAAGKSQGPLHGIPWGAKDLLAVKNYPTTWGVELYKNRILDHDAAVVTKLEHAGAVLCAKLSLGEFCMGDVWFNGMTRCPWNPKEGSSGSSAGPCAAVAAGLVPFAIGSETLGSIISPCMVNGTIGLRPTFGCISRFGAMPLSNSMDKLGPITRSVVDCAILLSILQGPDSRDPATIALTNSKLPAKLPLASLRVGFDPEAFNFDAEKYKKNPALKDLYQRAFDDFRALLNHAPVPVHIPPAKDYVGLASLVIACESASNFTDLLASGDIRKLKQQGDGTWPNTFRVGSTVPAADYLNGMKLRTQLQHAMADCMKDVDCFLTLPYFGPTISHTNLTGHPSLVFRAGLFNGRPKLLELIGQPFGESAILSLGSAFEHATSHNTQWPDTTKIPPLS